MSLFSLQCSTIRRGRIYLVEELIHDPDSESVRDVSEVHCLSLWYSLAGDAAYKARSTSLIRFELVTYCLSQDQRQRVGQDAAFKVVVRVDLLGKLAGHGIALSLKCSSQNFRRMRPCNVMDRPAVASHVLGPGPLQVLGVLRYLPWTSPNASTVYYSFHITRLELQSK